MINAHAYLESVREEGMDLFAATDLANDHSAITRRIRRDRNLRTATATLVSATAVASVALGWGPLNGAIGPADAPSTKPTSAEPSPHTVVETTSVLVKPGRRVEEVAAALGAAFRADRDAAYAAIVKALPPEAEGNPEGWIPAGEYEFDRSGSLQDAVDELVIRQVQTLMALEVPRDKWEETLILASIVAQEAPQSPDQAGVARVIVNRLAAGMPLEVDSPWSYIGQNYWSLVGLARPDTDDYDTFGRLGLPAGPIGAIGEDALKAAISPADGDWMYFLRDLDGNISLFATFEEFYAAVEAGQS